MNFLYSALDIAVPGTHGGSSHAWGTINALHSLKHRVIVFCANKRGEPFHEKRKGIHFYRMPLFFQGGFFKIAFMVLVSFFSIFYLLLFKKIDVVYERARIFGGIGVFLGKVFGKKTVLELNEPIIAGALVSGKLMERSFSFNLMKKWFYFTAKYADVITVTSESIAEAIPKEKVLEIHYAADPSAFSPVIDSSAIRKKLGLLAGKTVLYSGSFRRWHALDRVVEAAEILRRKEPHAKFLLLGSGPEFGKIKKMVEEKNLERTVLLLGNVSFEKVPEFINASDVCLSLFDPMFPLFQEFGYFYSPIKVHEYKSCAKPVIATGIGNLRLLVKDGVNGFLVKNNNAGEIAGKISELLSDNELRKKMGEKNRKEVLGKYNWRNVTEKVLNALKGK